MKKSTKIVLGAIALVVVLLVAASYLGVIDVSSVFGAPEPATPENQVDLQLSDFEIFSVLETLFNKDLNYAEVQLYIDSLHMKVYGRDDMNAQQLLQWFEAEYALDGWTSQGMTPQYAGSWVAYHEAWTRGADARSVSVGEGAGVTSVFGHETVYLITHGPATTYWQFWNVVK